jgi:hypothetical protein
MQWCPVSTTRVDGGAMACNKAVLVVAGWTQLLQQASA